MAKLNELTATQVRARQMRRERAERLLRHYLKLAWEKAGLRWDGDNDAEVRELVELLMEGD